MGKDDLVIPAEFNDPERRVANAILRAARAKSGGGCRAFYTAFRWRARGEQFGNDADFVVCHDGGDLAPAFNPSYEDFRAMKRVEEAVGKNGYRTESLTCWCTGIYRNAGAKKVALPATVEAGENTVTVVEYLGGEAIGLVDADGETFSVLSRRQAAELGRILVALEPA